MTQQLWLYKGEPSGRRIAGVNPLISRALQRRGITDELMAWGFLHPETLSLSGPRLLKDMSKAVERIEKAVSDGEKVCVYGDFDVDGVTATAIMTDCLRTMGLTVISYVPDRELEGYGMNADSVRKLASMGVRLIVTVDNGIAAIEEIRLCAELNIDVVVLDHHKCHETLPECAAVVSSSRDAYSHWVNDLCGAGVAFKAACALVGQRADKYLPLVALATVADAVSLTRENRKLVYEGMTRVRENLGLKLLLEEAGADHLPLDEGLLAFTIAPRLNAAGRVGIATDAVELLLCTEEGRARELAAILNSLNKRRRDLEQLVMEQCLDSMSSNNNTPAIVIRNAGWKTGVIGIAASRLVERYGRPTILCTRVEDGTLRGSCRSVEGVDMFALLKDCSEYLIRFGGHAGAAGLTLESGKFDAFRKAVMEKLSGRTFELKYMYEERLSLSDCTMELYRAMAALAPFGMGNEEPIYLIEGCQLKNLTAVGKYGKHLRATLVQDGVSRKLVAFNMGDFIGEWKSFSTVDVLVKLSENSFFGEPTCELRLVALREKII